MAAFFQQNGQAITVFCAMVTATITIAVGAFTIHSKRKRNKESDSQVRLNEAQEAIARVQYKAELERLESERARCAIEADEAKKSAQIKEIELKIQLERLTKERNENEYVKRVGDVMMPEVARLEAEDAAAKAEKGPAKKKITGKKEKKR